jgi:tRNA-dihydrouridine synthase B
MTIIPAPLAGYTDFAFRKILHECGAQEVWTEMISAAALYRGNEKTKGMLGIVTGARNVVQIFGNKPEYFASVIMSGVLDDFAEININMGCPAPKIAKDDSGCTLMRNLALAKKIIAACRDAIKKHGKKQILSVKMRLGWNKNIAVHFAQMCESAGADRVIVHGRLGIFGYSGDVDYNAIAEVKSAVKIPVIANGNITDEPDARRCIAVTRADGVMVGRALLGSPWKINMDGRTPPKDEMKKIIKRHIELFTAGGDNFADFKKHALFYCNSLGSGKEIKRRVASAKNIDEIKELLDI